MSFSRLHIYIVYFGGTLRKENTVIATIVKINYVKIEKFMASQHKHKSLHWHCNVCASRKDK